MNKYIQWYNQITQNGKQRREGYTECHHIIPRSLGGTHDTDNLTNLTAREHFICHWLLTKIYATGEAHWKMLNAFRMMRAENPRQQRYQTKITSRVYENLKREYSVLQSQRVAGKNNPMYGDKFYRSEEGKQRQSKAISGDSNGAKQTDARIKISESKRGKQRAPFSDKWLAKLKEAHRGERNGMHGKKHTDETKELMRQRAIGRQQSVETIQKKADAIRGSKREKRLCPHCQQMIAVNGYARWHGPNCRTLKS